MYKENFSSQHCFQKYFTTIKKKENITKTKPCWHIIIVWSMTEKLLDLILKPISNKSYNQIDKILVYILSLWSQPWVTIEYIINYIFFFVIRSRSSTIFQIQYISEDDYAQCPLRPLSSVAIYCHEYKSLYNFFSRKVISRDKKNRMTVAKC